MLSEEERRRIEAEEVSALQARQAASVQTRQDLAALAYRREVRAALSPRPAWWPVRWAVPFMPVIVIAVVLALRPATPTQVLDDALGGITTADLVSRCRVAVAAKVPWPADELRFPALTDAAAGITATADGKRWDGQLGRPDGRLLDFTCTYSPADDHVGVDLLEAP